MLQGEIATPTEINMALKKPLRAILPETKAHQDELYLAEGGL